MSVSPLSRKQARVTRRTRRSLTLLLSLLLATAGALPGTSRAMRASAPKDDTPARPHLEFMPGEVLVRFRSEAVAVKGRRAAMALRARGGEIMAEVEDFDGSEIVKGLRVARVAKADTLNAVAAFNARADVLYAEPNYIWRKTRLPNDARFPEMWGLKNTGQVGFNDYTEQSASGTPGADIDAELAWDITTGSRSVVVGVLDGGADINHPDLKDNIWVNPGEVPNNNLDDDGNGFIDDVNGWDFHHNDKTIFDNEDGDDHATHVSGTIGATGNNGVGVTGVNWQVSIMELKVLGPDGGSTTKIINGYNYVRMMRERGVNIRVLNNSYGGGGKSQAAFEAINALNGAGILFVAAAGNESVDNFGSPHYPSGYDLPNVLGVAATDRFEQIAKFSNFGARLVSMGAPGRGVLSTIPNGDYQFFSGTSMASPHVAGAAALVLAINPSIAVQNLRGVLAYSGEVTPSLQGKTTTGRRLNAHNSIQSALENDTTPPAGISDLRATGQNGRGITFAWTAPGDDGNSGRAADYDFVFVNPTTGARILLPSTLIPDAGGTPQSATVDIPFRNFSGTVELRTFDNAGNFSATSISISAAVNAGTDPYILSLEGASGLSSGGERLVLDGDDKYLENFQLPFTFPFFGTGRSSLAVSTNGSLYFSKPIKRESGDAGDVPSSIEGLTGQAMIAGMWDDLIVDSAERASDGVFVTKDANRIIFRWQGVTFPDYGGGTRGKQPITFEIELQSSGLIQMRYGAGQSAPTNTRLVPVVGISAGEPDAYVVGTHTSETALVNLTNAQSLTFTARPAVVVPPNPIDATDAFVRQQYLDFFSREPDPGGFAFWMNNINSCGANTQCREDKRIDTSAAFFLSIEFQETGYLVYRLYQSTFGRAPVPLSFIEFLPDTQEIGRGVVIGQPGALDLLEANKRAFVEKFVARSGFLAQYPTTLTPEQYVAALNENTKPSLSQAERDTLVAGLKAGTETRATVLRKVAEDADLKQKEFNRAFVLIQYFGYLRRNPNASPDTDFSGYNFWLNKLNEFNGDFRRAEMVNAFSTSGEYRRRFGP